MVRDGIEPPTLRFSVGLGESRRGPSLSVLAAQVAFPSGAHVHEHSRMDATGTQVGTHVAVAVVVRQAGRPPCCCRCGLVPPGDPTPTGAGVLGQSVNGAGRLWCLNRHSQDAPAKSSVGPVLAAEPRARSQRAEHRADGRHEGKTDASAHRSFRTRRARFANPHDLGGPGTGQRRHVPTRMVPALTCTPTHLASTSRSKLAWLCQGQLAPPCQR